jgi:hypothetical protein
VHDSRETFPRLKAPCKSQLEPVSRRKEDAHEQEAAGRGCVQRRTGGRNCAAVLRAHGAVPTVVAGCGWSVLRCGAVIWS